MVENLKMNDESIIKRLNIIVTGLPLRQSVIILAEDRTKKVERWVPTALLEECKF